MNKLPNTKLEEEEIVEDIEENIPDIKDIEKESPFVEEGEDAEEEEQEEQAQEEEVEIKPKEINFNNLTKKALQMKCKEQGIKRYSKLTKPNLIKLLNGEEIIEKPKKKKEIVEEARVVERVEEAVEEEARVSERVEEEEEIIEEEEQEEEEEEEEEEEIILVKPTPIKKKTIPKKKKKAVVKQVKKVRNVLIKEKPLITQNPPLTEKKLHNPFKNLYSIS